MLIYKGNGSGYNTTASWDEAGPSGSGFGASVDWGFVSDSGYPALIVGAPGASSAAGAVYEFLNSSPLPDTTPDLTLSGASTGDLFGYSISSRADQNADTYDDLIVGAPNATYSSLTGAGKVYLFQGSSSGLGSTAAWSTGGSGTNASFGASVALGYVNSDLYADVIVGAPNYSSATYSLTQDGYASLFLTSTSTYLPVHAQDDLGLYSYINTGTSVAWGPSLVDFDSDIIIGVPGGSTSTAPSVDLLYWSP